MIIVNAYIIFLILCIGLIVLSMTVLWMVVLVMTSLLGPRPFFLPRTLTTISLLHSPCPPLPILAPSPRCPPDIFSRPPLGGFKGIPTLLPTPRNTLCIKTIMVSLYTTFDDCSLWKLWQECAEYDPILEYVLVNCPSICPDNEVS